MCLFWVLVGNSVELCESLELHGGREWAIRRVPREVSEKVRKLEK